MNFRTPKKVKLGAKFLVYGTTGSGKSLFMLGFPQIAAIDSEAGLAFYEGRECASNLSIISNTQSYKDLEDAIDEIKDNFEELKIKTFAVDSVTKIRENLEETIMTLDEKRERAKGKDVEDTNLSVRSRGRIKYVSKKLQNLKIDLSTQGVNIIDIAQAKEVKEKRGDNYVFVGYEPDTQRGTNFDYDVVLFFSTKEDSDGNIVYYAKVEKDRTGATKKGQVIQNPSYEIWKDLLEDLDSQEALKTSFSTDIDNAKSAYEKEVEEENKSLIDKIRDLMVALDDDGKTEFKKALKAAGLSDLKGIDKLSPAKKEALLEVIESFK